MPEVDFDSDDANEGDAPSIDGLRVLTGWTLLPGLLRYHFFCDTLASITPGVSFCMRHKLFERVATEEEVREYIRLSARKTGAYQRVAPVHPGVSFQRFVPQEPILASLCAGCLRRVKVYIANGSLSNQTWIG
jgi:hypothetical protein